MIELNPENHLVYSPHTSFSQSAAITQTVPSFLITNLRSVTQAGLLSRFPPLSPLKHGDYRHEHHTQFSGYLNECQLEISRMMFKVGLFSPLFAHGKEFLGVARSALLVLPTQH